MNEIAQKVEQAPSHRKVRGQIPVTKGFSYDRENHFYDESRTGLLLFFTALFLSLFLLAKLCTPFTLCAVLVYLKMN